MGERGAIEAKGVGKVLGVLAGTDMPASQVEAWVRSADLIYAADGAANLLLSINVRPDVVIGDFDSATSEATRFAKMILRGEDQESSDCDKLLSLVQAGGAEAVTLCNVEGDRPDHFIATLQSAVKADLHVRFAFRRGFGYLIKAGSPLVAPFPIGARLSLMPLEKCEGTYLEGVKWPLAGASLSASQGNSLSNVVTKSDVRAKIASGSALLTVLHPSLEEPSW